MISVVIPVYNEAESASTLYGELVAVLDRIGESYELIFVDDGSRDDTLEVLKSLPRATVISFTRNFGKSQALSAGFAEAKGDVVFTLDGDLQDDPAEIPAFLESVKAGNDLVCGWKFKRHDPWGKRFASKIANGVTRWFTGVHVHDMNCGFKAYRRPLTQELRLYGDMHRYIPALATMLGFRVAEVKVNHRARQFGRSKYGFGRLFRGLFDFITLIFLRKFTDRPMHFFGVIGLVLNVIGLLTLAYLTWIKLAYDELIGSRPLLLLGVLLVVIGFQSLTFGLLGELVIRQNSDRSRLFVIREKVTRA